MSNAIFQVLEAVVHAHGRPRWSWHDEGFLSQPKPVPVRRPLPVYRVWGGTATETGSPTRPGACFSLEKPRSRKEAERLFSLWEWGNSCRFVTEFVIKPGATIFVGTVHPGDCYDHGLGVPGSQIFVETPQVNLFVRKIGAAQPLIDDIVGGKVIVPNRDPGRKRSS